MVKKNRVLHILTSLKAGGAETNLLALLRHLDKELFEHAVAFGEGGDLEKEFSETGAKLIKLSKYPLSLRYISHFPSAVKMIAEYQPDIIHAHLDIPNILGLIGGYATGAKVILHFHGFGIYYKELSNTSRLKNLLWKVLSQSYRYCDRALAICDYQWAYLQRVGISRQKIRKIPNGITIDEMFVRPAKFDRVNMKDTFCFVNVARLHPQKNHELLISAFSEVFKQCPQTHLIIAGDGSLRSKIQEQIKELCLENRVSILGMRRDIPAILASCDCFVQSSNWELSPITILEAMRAKLPMIATKVGGVSEMVEDKKSGILFEPNDCRKLVESMVYMVKHSQQACQMGESGYKRVIKKFSNSIIVMQIEDVYKEIIVQ